MWWKICKYLQIKSLRSICIFTSSNKSQNFIKKKKKEVQCTHVQANISWASEGWSGNLISKFCIIGNCFSGVYALFLLYIRLQWATFGLAVIV